MWIAIMLLNITILSFIGLAAYNALKVKINYYSIFGLSVFLVSCGFSPTGSLDEMAIYRLYFYVMASIITTIWLIYGKFSKNL